MAIVITFDEDDNSGDNTVLTTVIAPTVDHVSAATPLTHYSLTRYLAELTATPPRRGSHRSIAGHRVRPVTTTGPPQQTGPPQAVATRGGSRTRWSGTAAGNDAVGYLGDRLVACRPGAFPRRQRLQPPRLRRGGAAG